MEQTPGLPTNSSGRTVYISIYLVIYLSIVSIYLGEVAGAWASWPREDLAQVRQPLPQVQPSPAQSQSAGHNPGGGPLHQPGPAPPHHSPAGMCCVLRIFIFLFIFCLCYGTLLQCLIWPIFKLPHLLKIENLLLAKAQDLNVTFISQNVFDFTKCVQGVIFIIPEISLRWLQSFLLSSKG